MLTGDHTVLYLPTTHLIHKWNESYLPLLRSHSASPDLVWYSFFILLRVEGQDDMAVNSNLSQY